MKRDRAGLRTPPGISAALVCIMKYQHRMVRAKTWFPDGGAVWVDSETFTKWVELEQVVSWEVAFEG